MATPSTHLMIVHARYAPEILSGRKSVESRLGRDRRAPFGRACPGELLYIKAAGGPVFASTRIERVDEFEDLTPEDLDRLCEVYEPRVLGGRAYWDAKRDARVATMIWMGPIRPVRDLSRVPAALLEPSRHAWRTIDAPHAARARRAA